MKKYISLLVLLFNFTISQAQISLASLGLKGRIKEISVSTYEFEEKFGEAEIGTNYNTQVAEFNENGFLIKRKKMNDARFSGDEELDDFQKSRILSERTIEYLFFDDGKLKEINEYEEKGEFQDERALVFKTKFKYDEAGKFIDKRIYNGDGNLINTSTNLEKPILNVSTDSSDLGRIMSSSNFFPEIHRNSDLDDDDVKSSKGLANFLVSKTEKVDQEGNWAKILKYKDGKLAYGIERKIIYY